MNKPQNPPHTYGMLIVFLHLRTGVETPAYYQVIPPGFTDFLCSKYSISLMRGEMS
jgi:hypothetical protein